MDEDLTVRASLRDELTRPLRNIRDELRDIAKQAGDTERKANLGARGFDRMASGAGRFVKAGVGVAAKAAAAGVAALTTAAVVGSLKVLQLASDAAETASAFGTVFKGVSGDVAGYVRRMNSEFGLTTESLQRAATTFGVFGKAAGVPKKALGEFTKDLVGAGMDLSSFYNADPGDVFLALKSGLAGEAEPLRQFGIFLSDAAMKAEAATMGLTGELTESQKVMVRQRIIMKSLGDAEGDLARTKDGLANKTKALKGRLTELGTQLGDRLRPHAEKAAAALDGRLKGVLDTLPQTLDRVERKAGKMLKAWQGGGIDGVVDKLDRMTGSGGKLSDAWDKAKSVADDLGTIVSGVLAPALGDAGAATLGLSSPLTLLDNVIGFVADHTTAFRVGLTLLVVGLTVAKVATLTKAAADKVALIWLKAHTQGTKTHLVVTKAAAIATKAWAVAQRILNVAMRANPLGIVITAIGLLVGAFVLAYNKSDTFRGIVDKVWEGLKTFGSWIKGTLIKYLGDLGAALLRMAAFGVKAYGFLVRAAIKAFDGILWAAEKGLGWVPGLGDKIKGARAAFDEFGDKTVAKLDRVEAKLRTAADAADRLGEDRSSTITVTTVERTVTPGGTQMGPRIEGDTATRRGRNAGAFHHTMAAHQRAQAATGARLTITNAFTGGGGKGRGSGDHQAGRALDVKGKGIAAYGRHIRAEGGYFAMHGSGSSRHGHAVPAAAGDTVHSRARSSSGSSAGGGTVTIEAGAIVVDARNASADVDVTRAVKQGIEDWFREREERG